MSSRRWCYTLNNYNDEDLSSIQSWDVKYHVRGKEVGESGTPHLQGFVIFKKQLRLSAVKKLHARMHWEAAKGTSEQASDYCKKEGNFEEVGEVPNQGKRTDLETVTELVKQGASVHTIATEHPTVYVKFHRGLNALALAIQKPYGHTECRGIWLYGPPGIGKSYLAREKFPYAYLKPQSKWFDGYAGEDTIILDDMDKGGTCLAHHLKIWADRYPCTGETKGGTVALQHKRFIITSNWSISQLFKDADDVMITAIERRFDEYRFEKEFVQPDEPVGYGKWKVTITPPLKF